MQRSAYDTHTERRPWWRDTHQFRDRKPAEQKTLRAHRGGRVKEMGGIK